MTTERQKKSVVKSLAAKTSNGVNFRDYLVIILKALKLTFEINAKHQHIMLPQVWQDGHNQL